MKLNFNLFSIVGWVFLLAPQVFGLCNYQSKSEKHSVETCLRADVGSEVQIKPEVLQTALYNKYALASLEENKVCFWFTRRGKVMKTPCSEKHNDDSSEGSGDEFSAKLARYISSDGRYGFMNWSLMPVISAKWDYATPFQTTFAKVCENCKDGKGGKWSIINLKGRVVKKCALAQTADECTL